MKRILAITRREFHIYFDSPIAYIFIVLFLGVSGAWFFYFRHFFLQGQATMRYFFDFLPIILCVFLPAITMRLWAEERRAGTEELLLTLPIRGSEAVFGKFLAGWFLLGIALVGSLPLAITVSLLGPLDWGPVIGGYLGAMLLGGAGLSLGLFLSSLTGNQIIAFIMTVTFLLLFLIIGWTEVLINLPASVVPWLEYASLLTHYKSALRGVIDVRDVVFYVSFMALCLYLTQAVIAWRKRA